MDSKRLTDPTFKYVPAAKTDIAATFRRIKREIAEAKARAEAEQIERISKVRALK